MAEQRIEVTIDENGKISASTEGFKGEICIEELQKILKDLADWQSVSKTDEFYQTNELKKQTKIEIEKR